MYSNKHVQLGESPTARQIEFGPQGDGSQGALFGGGASVYENIGNLGVANIDVK